MIPAFTRGKPQLSGEEVENSRKIANVRIHIEHAIGLLRRRFTILTGVMPIKLVQSAVLESRHARRKHFNVGGGAKSESS